MHAMDVYPGTSGAWRVFLAAALGASGLLSCSVQSDPGEGALRLVRISPRSGSDQMALNDDVRIVFNEVLDPSSRTKDAVRLERVDRVPLNGRQQVLGRWRIEGRELRFQPKGPTRPDLTDGGFQPGATYALTLTGFPGLSGPRSLRGARLQTSIVHYFSTVSVAGSKGAGSGEAEPELLKDASPRRAARLQLGPDAEGASEGRPLAWDASLRVSCAEPIDPRTLHPEDFEVRPFTRASRQVGREAVQARAVPVKFIRLLRNEDEDSVDPALGAAALIEVTLQRNLPLRDGASGFFDLVLRPGVPDGGGPLDYSGTPVYGGPVRFVAARQDTYVPERKGSYDVEFLNAQDFIPVLDPASDGTALWSESGRLEVRYPRAAGTGEAGDVVLEGRIDAEDLHATRAEVPEGKEAQLAGVGLVVLRSQGRLDVNGDLLRSLPEGTEPRVMWELGARLRPNEQETLTEWLARAREAGEAWTVLIAGGDLVIRGEIDVETPLLLVAGGRIRGDGVPKSMPGQLWILGEGGFAARPLRSSDTAWPRQTPPLTIDEPVFNQLKEPLEFVAISSEVPKGTAPSDWGSPRVFGHRGKTGSYRVQFLRPDALGSTGGEPKGRDGDAPRSQEDRLGQAVRHDEPKDVAAGDDPMGIGRGSRVRLRIELRLMPPNARRNALVWDPPFVDRVRLFWTPDP
ncbi:MAG: Ig-like domain-containing protein [Planctomycetota bacterium]